MGKLKYLLFMFLLSFFSLTNTNALVDGCISSGTSFLGSAKLGSKVIGSNYYYEFSSGTYNESNLNVNFCTDWQMNDSISGTKNVNFVVEYCVNGSLPTLNVWSSYSNFVDFTYPTGKSIYLADGEWSRAQCYQSFLSLNLKYSDNVGTSSLYNTTTFTSNNNNFGLYADYGYNVLLRYTDLIYYNNDDYNNLLIKTKDEYNSQTIINQNDTIINQQTEAENTRKGIWETIKSIPSSILNGFKSLFIPEDMSFLDDFKDTISDKLGFIAQIPIAVIDFGIDLVNLDVEEMSSVTFPTIEIMGVHFWPEMEVDITPILTKFSSFKYLTDILCVTLCVYTLNRWREKFTGGGETK